MMMTIGKMKKRSTPNKRSHRFYRLWRQNVLILDAAATVLDATPPQEPIEPEPAVVSEEKVEPASSASDDPWADVDYSEEE